MGESCFESHPANVTQLLFDRLFRGGEEGGDIICRFVIMHQQALQLPVKWNQVNGGGAETGEENWRAGHVFKDTAVLRKLPPPLGINSVHLAQK